MWFMQELIAYLAETLGIGVATTLPVNDENPFVTVVYTGGRSDRFTEHPSITVHAWAASDLEAALLCHDAADALLAFHDHSMNTVASSMQTMYEDAYVDGHPRWTAVFDFTINR